MKPEFKEILFGYAAWRDFRDRLETLVLDDDVDVPRAALMGVVCRAYSLLEPDDVFAVTDTGVVRLAGGKVKR